nr:retrovirus-related Pol polyprotein from transposon TNT 1-94 [Tanacetum cinerariifolium]
MVLKTKDWVKRLNPDSKLLNFNSGRILVPKSQAVNESLETLNTLESYKDFEANFLTSLPPLRNLQGASPSLKILKVKEKPFPLWTHCDFNDHRPDDCRNYPECEIYGSCDHSTSGHNHVIHIRRGVLAESSQSNESSIRYHLGKFNAKADDGYFLGHSSVSKAFRVYNIRRQQIEETYHVTFNESMEAIRFTNTSVDEIGIDDSSRYPPDEFLHEDDSSRQYQVDFDISHYVNPHELSLIELT